jgi:bifunctional non-homologous end joining protein LigD
MSLKEYTRKRNFGRTAEPTAARAGKKGGSRRFVIQKHAASRLHYDFRIELGGTLKSWAVPKGVPYEKGEKRLAVQVEDHPVSYIEFEGVIPKDQYGGGTVMVWDRGVFEPLTRTPTKDLASGKLHFTLHGKKLSGEWRLVRLRDENEWLLIKGGEDIRPPTRKQDDTSALSGKNMRQLSKGDRVWQSKPRTGSDRRARRAAAPMAKSAPLPPFVEPMKAKLVGSPPPGDWLYEIKFDGFRSLALKGGSEARLLSRNRKDLGAKFPRVLDAILEIEAGDAVIDGEIVALDDHGRSSFQLLQAFELGDERPPLFFYAFDLLRIDGQNLVDRTVEERKSLLEELLKTPPDFIRYSASLGRDAKALLDQAREIGLEGLIGKRIGSRYESGRRSGAWIKLKLHSEQEFVIGGHTDPGGSRKHFGALLVGVYSGTDLRFVGKVGTGFNDRLLRALRARFRKLARKDCPFVNLPQKPGSRFGRPITASEMKRCHWIEPALVCQVRFSEWTRDDSLRQPVFLGLREDKDSREVIRERAS